MLTEPSTFMKDFLTGGIYAAVAKTSVVPIERVKLIMQVQAASKQIEAGREHKGIIDAFVRTPEAQDYARTCLGADVEKSLSERQYTALIDCITKTLKSNGPVGFHRGFLVSVQGIIIYRASYFGFFDKAKEMLPYPKNTPFIISILIA
ncbi:hypothetical protein WA026_009599 [Henosepilachna vigintioctopunctata]|uniref:ADP/ATP translocase n=1 Tax=Henosepilachna vigintioctopunctata TaxID=420089 RepID=A0AAW1TZV3_9CUCU